MNRHRQGYITNCPLRNDLLEILSSALLLKYGEHTAKEKEEFMLFTKNDSDAIDLTLHYIYYPLPYVKEIFIKDWKGGWETDQSFLHLEYWDSKWSIRKSTLLNKQRLENNSTLEGNDIVIEIINYFNDIDYLDVSKKMLRDYNLSKLV